MATTGMRRGEILGLRWSDVDLAAGTVTIRSTRIRYADHDRDVDAEDGAREPHDLDRTGDGRRAEGVEADTDRGAAADGFRLAERRRLVVTMPTGRRRIRRRSRTCSTRSSQRAGLRPIRLHDLRHSYATAALAAGVPVKVVSQRIGHADITVTLKVYAHVMPGDDEAAALQSDALLVNEDV